MCLNFWEEYVSCSVVLPSLCHLFPVMEVTEDDPAYVIKFKGTFTEDMESRKEKTNITWLRVATALDPRSDCHATFLHSSSFSVLCFSLVSSLVCFVRLLLLFTSFFALDFCFDFEFSIVEIGVLSQCHYTCTCTCIMTINFHFISFHFKV